MVLYVTIGMESAPANQIFLVTSVTNVLMDNMNFPTVMVSFCYPLFLPLNRRNSKLLRSKK